MEVIMLGAPGTRKGTQTKRIAVKYQIPHVLTGDIFRVSIRNGTELGMKAKAFTDAGGLVPDEIIVGMLLGRIHGADYQNRYVLDGLPRVIPQAEDLTKALGEMGGSIGYTINVGMPDENIVKRMSERRACLTCGATYHIGFNPPKKERVCDVCGQVLVLRSDDKPETVKKRPDVYHDQTRPFIEYYQKAGVLTQVDDTMDMGNIFQTIVKILEA